MTSQLILASSSSTRRLLLERVGLTVDAVPPNLDETLMIQGLLSEGFAARDVADALADAKARKVSQKHPDQLVLGCDQTADLEGTVLQKPRGQEEAYDQIKSLSGRVHQLYSAAVIYEGARPVWRFVGEARMSMRSLSDGYIRTYVARNWDNISTSVGAYRLEEEGARLFQSVNGDYFTILGLPLLPILSYLATRGVIET